MDELKGAKSRRGLDPIVISPVSLFESAGARDRYPQERAQYTFVQCGAGADSELDAAIDWIEKYVRKYSGRVITNFDEQRPVLAEAPLSYQRLVAGTYDRTVIERFHGTIQVDRIDALIQQSSITQNMGDVHPRGAQRTRWGLGDRQHRFDSDKRYSDDRWFLWA